MTNDSSFETFKQTEQVAVAIEEREQYAVQFFDKHINAVLELVAISPDVTTVQQGLLAHFVSVDTIVESKPEIIQQAKEIIAYMIGAAAARSYSRGLEDGYRAGAALNNTSTTQGEAEVIDETARDKTEEGEQ